MDTARLTIEQCFNKSKLSGRGLNWNCGMKCAATEGHIDIVRFIIEEAELRRIGLDWNFCMNSAAESGHTDIVQLMIEKGATDHITSMYNAVRNGNVEVVRLLHKTYNVNMTNYLATASMFNYWNLINFIIENIVDDDINYCMTILWDTSCENDHIEFLYKKFRKIGKNLDDMMSEYDMLSEYDIYLKKTINQELLCLGPDIHKQLPYEIVGAIKEYL